MFGPHVTNLGDDERRFTARHIAYYERRARGGCGVIVTEGASVHDSDWPYERAPLADRASVGWAAIADACHAHGSLVIAALDHAGGQGASAYHQRELWAPSRVPGGQHPRGPQVDGGRATSRAVVDGFATGAARGRRRRVRRGRDQRRPAQPGAPVPQRPDQPARRRVGPRPAASGPRRDHRGARRRGRRRRRAAPVVRRAGTVGRDHARAGAGDRRRARRPGRRLPRRRARSDLLRREDPARLPRADRVQHRRVPRRARRGVRRARVPAGLGGRSGSGRVGARRRCRRRGGDDPRPDRRPRPRRQAARRRRRAHPPVHPLQPDLPGARRAQPDRHVRRRADERPGDRGPRLVPPGDDGARRARRRRRPGRAWRPRGSPSARGHRVRIVERADHLGGVAAVRRPGGAARRLADPRVRVGPDRPVGVGADERLDRRRRGAVHRRPRRSSRVRDRGRGDRARRRRRARRDRHRARRDDRPVRSDRRPDRRRPSPRSSASGPC